tara:strand:+ start:13547 stop:13744 length:198 start_codon:yes stop_codon:yes gene_type:complete
LLAAGAFVLYHVGSGGSLNFWSFLMAEKKMIVERERSQIEAEEIWRLMRGDGNQSRINDGKLAPS